MYYNLKSHNARSSWETPAISKYRDTHTHMIPLQLIPIQESNNFVTSDGGGESQVCVAYKFTAAIERRDSVD